MSDSIDIASKDLWERAKTIYVSTLFSDSDKSQAERYFSMITNVVREGDVLKIYCSNEFATGLLRDTYGDKIKTCLKLAGSNDELKLEFVYKATVKPALIIPRLPENPTNEHSSFHERPSSFVSTMPLDENYTFDEYVRGPSNSWALAAAQGVVAHPGKASYNPLFIHGGTGLGKTHLMQAIGNELRKKYPEMSICYLTAETFLNEFVNALKNGQIESFRNRYRTIDLLLVDDVQFLQKGNQCQEEFFNTFNALQQKHKQIVMTSDVAPKNLPAIEERLISRFEGGMVQEIESPNYETRLAILRKKSEGMIPSIPDSTLEFIADNIKSHVRAIEGALGKVNIFRSMDQTAPLTNETLTVLLKDFIEKEQTMKKVTIKEIQTSIARRFGVTIDQILSLERTQSIVTPRQLAMYVSRKFTTNSLPEIATAFEKTHATIVHGVKNIEKRLDVESDLRATLSEILAEFGLNMSDKM